MVSSADNIFQALMGVIDDRKAHPTEKSYTTSLLRKGLDEIGAKITEEAGEGGEAAAEAVETRADHVAHEAADVIYHLFVLLAHTEVPLSAVEAKLAGRFGISGLEEKASRSQK